MKWKLVECPSCKEETRHRVKKSCGIDHRRGMGFVRYIIYHCTQCNKKRRKL